MPSTHLQHLDRANALVNRVPAIDNHACMPLRANDGAFLPQLSRVKAAGWSAVSLNIGFGEQTPAEHLAVTAWFRRWLEQHGDAYMMIETADDVARARAAGKLGVYFDIEGSRAIGDDLNMVQLYRDLGARWMLIAYNRANLAGSGCYDEIDEGLTAFGRDMIAEMERAGMTLCLSHTGARTAREALDVARKPVIFSHSNCAALQPHKRNISDDMIRACAQSGGVVGINGIGDFLGPAGTDYVEAVARHIDHVVQLVGPAHAGIALDYVFDQAELEEFLAKMAHTFPEKMSDKVEMVSPEALPEIVAHLMARGYDETSLEAIIGGNWLRVARETWPAH